jgi:YcaO-like protein with predicted kinase domain
MKQKFFIPVHPALKPQYNAALLGGGSALIFSPYEEFEFAIKEVSSFNSLITSLNGHFTLEELAQKSRMNQTEVNNWIVFLALKNLLQEGPVKALKLNFPGNIKALPLPKIPSELKTKLNRQTILVILPELLQKSFAYWAKKFSLSNYKLGDWKTLKTQPAGFKLVIAAAQSSLKADWAPKILKLNLPVIYAEYSDTEVIIGPTLLSDKTGYLDFQTQKEEARLIKAGDYIKKGSYYLSPTSLNRIKLIFNYYLVKEAFSLITANRPAFKNRILLISLKAPQGNLIPVLTKTAIPESRMTPPAIPEIHKVSTSPQRAKLTIKKTQNLIGKLGIIPYFQEVKTRKLIPVVRSYSADVEKTGLDLQHLGKGLTLQEAQASAIGEAIERYCAKLRQPDNLLLLSYEEVKNLGYAPLNFNLAEIYRAGFNSKAKMAWVWGVNLTKTQTCLVPADWVYLNPLKLKDAVNIAAPTSGGLGAALTLEEALLHGILENIEKDAWIIMERHKLCLPDIVIDNPDKSLSKLLTILNRQNIKYYAKYLTLDLNIPVAGVLLRQDTQTGENFAYAGAAHLDASQALLNAFLEAAQMFPVPYREWKTLNPEYEIAHRQNPGKTRLTLSELPKINTNDLKAQIQACLADLKTRGLETLYVNLSKPGIALKVVRVIIPGLQPLYAKESPHYSQRLFNLPYLLGYTDKTGTPQDLYEGELLGFRTLKANEGSN